MQATEDGEFYPEKPLDANYKIPRRAQGDMSAGNKATFSADPRAQQTGPSVQTPLATAYYNYPYDPNSASAYYNYSNHFRAGQQVMPYNFAAYGVPTYNNTSNINACASSSTSSANVNQTAIGFGAPPPPPPPNGSNPVDTLKRNIFETFNSIREKPKLYGTGGKTIHNNQSEPAPIKPEFANKTEARANQNNYRQPPPNANNFNTRPDNNNKPGFANPLFNRPVKPENDHIGHNQKQGFFNQNKDNFQNQNINQNKPNNQDKFQNRNYNQARFNANQNRPNQGNFQNQHNNQPRFNANQNRPNQGNFQNQHNNQARFNANQNFGNQGPNQQRFGNQQRFNNQQEGFNNNRGFGNNQQRFNKNESWNVGNKQQWNQEGPNRYQGNFDQGYDQNYDESFDHQYEGGNNNWSRLNSRGFGNNQRFNKDLPNKPRFGKRRYNDDQSGYDRYDSCMERGYGQYNEQGGDDNKLFQSSGKFKGFGFVNQKKKKKEPPVELPVEQTVPDLLDESLPKDLKTLFQPLFCKLCEAQLSSNQTAKMHYKSKNHEKKIRKWLIEYAEKTGEQLHPRATVTAQEKKKDNKEEAEKNPIWFHCDVCDLDLTGKMHAESHYMGRNHQKALLGHRNPAGVGYYDADGKWIRIKNQKSKSYDFEKGEDNFGLAFKPDGGAAAADATEQPPPKKKKTTEPKEFHCDVCNINTTCQEQLDIHFMGQKHIKKLKQLGLENYTDQRKIIQESAPDIPTTTPVDLPVDVTAYRTPSGDFYCPSCNLTLNSEVQFLQHMKSKGHAKKLTQKKDDVTPIGITSPLVIGEGDASGGDVGVVL